MTVIELIGKLKGITHADDFEALIAYYAIKSIIVDRVDKCVILGTDECNDEGETE